MNYQGAITALGALIVVLGLVLLAAQVARRFGLAPGLPGRAGAAGRRLAVLEALPLDGKRRLLLLRCDGRELLLLTGGPQDLLLQTLPPATPTTTDAAAPAASQPQDAV